MTAKTLKHEGLFQTIQNLSEDKMRVVFEFIRTLQDEDDEPLSEEDLKALDRVDEEIAAGHFYTLDEFNHKMAKLP